MALTVSPAKVARIIARLNTGGPAIHTVLLTRAVDPLRFDSRLVTGAVDPSEGDMGYYAEAMGVTPVTIAGLGRHVGAGELIAAFGRLWMWLRRERPAIIHTHTTTAGALGRVAGVLYNVEARVRRRPPARLVHTFHGHVLHGYFSRRRSRVLALGERLLAHATDRIVAVSELVGRDLVERHRVCSRAKLSVIPLGFDFGWVDRLGSRVGEMRDKHGIPASTVLVAIVGRLTAIKNHALLLAALSRLRAPDVRALVVGDGELRGVLEEAARAGGLGDRAVFTGWERDQARIYADVHVVCLTSRNEGTPVALIEAMAAGKPFVATDVGGVRDLAAGEPTPAPGGFAVFSNCVLVPPDDADALAAALDWLAARPETRVAMGEVGRTVAKRFSRDRLVRSVEALYAELLGS